MRIEPATPESVKEAAEVLRTGGLVVLPTETVYGLACNALDTSAVKKVYEIKGRPSENPLIVHLADFADLGSVAESWTEDCENLAKRFWPGPMTLVLPKKDNVPSETTGGLDTVAVRIPDHPLALTVIRTAGVPLAAPSANPFMGLSPTCAEDIEPEIGDNVDLVLDGGTCEIGLESTVIDLSGDHPRILRPGGITRAQIQAVIGRPLGHLPPPTVNRSPGMYPRHYAPKAKLKIVTKLERGQTGLTFSDCEENGQIKMPDDPKAYAASLYRALRKLDKEGVEIIFVENPPDDPDWEAVHDRLQRASG